MLIKSVLFSCCCKKRHQQCCFMGVIRRRRHLLFSYMKSKFKRTFLFPGSISEQRNFPHHSGWESTFKIWFINGARSSINSSSSPYKLCQKGSHSTGAGQQPGTAWQAASHSAMNWRGFLRECYSFSVFPPLLQLKMSCRVCMYSLWIPKAMLLFHWMLS